MDRKVQLKTIHFLSPGPPFQSNVFSMQGFKLDSMSKDCAKEQFIPAIQVPIFCKTVTVINNQDNVSIS